MKMTNCELIKRIDKIHPLVDVGFPVKLSYALQKNHSKMIKEYQFYFNQLMSLKKKFGYENDSIKNPIENKDPEYLKEVDSLLNIEVDVEIHTITDEVFKDSEFIMSANQLAALEFMIEQEE